MIKGTLTKLAAAALAFGATLGTIQLAGQEGADMAPSAPAHHRTTDELIRDYSAALDQHPEDARGYAALGQAFVQKVRETGNTDLYDRADSLFRQALRRDPANLAAMIGRGGVANSRHDFAAGLRFARQARRTAPDTLGPLPVLVDSQIELGRYREAARALQQLVDLKPNVASYTRISYWRELHGDIDGAIAAAQRAVSASGEAGEGSAYVYTLLGKLEFARGNFDAARRAYDTALVRFPNYLGAEAELGRLAGAEGRLAESIRLYRDVTRRLPLPESVVLLAETEQAAGHTATARRYFRDSVRREHHLLESGSQPDADTALLETAAGDRGMAVRYARIAWRHSPSVRSADALGWALTNVGRPREGLRWARRALALGSVDPRLLYHAAVAAERAGQPDHARRWLTTIERMNPRFSPLFGPKAMRLLESVRSSQRVG
jgi:tetratricopeptide (TPR) repeat protein